MKNNNNMLMVDTSKKKWQKEVSKAMKKNKTIKITTLDKEWNPNSDSPNDIAKWIWGSAFPVWVTAIIANKKDDSETKTHNKNNSDNPAKVIPTDDEGKLAIAGASGLALIGAGMILLAFFDPEPTSKLSLLVGGGIAASLSGGALFYILILSRKKYSWSVSYDPKTGKTEWTASPK